MKDLKSPYQNRKIILASKHEKERALQSLLEEAFNSLVITAEIDTDTLGTFTCEVERKDDPFTTAMKKCELAFQLTGEPLCLASEGSFGPHPQIGFIAADQEILVLTDFENDHFIRAKAISTKTNFNASICTNLQEVLSFAENAYFPSHALIIQPDKNIFFNTHKGITDRDYLITLSQNLLKEYGKLYIQTDMRALYNPMRMEVIKEAGKKLVTAMQHQCLQCGFPGMEMTTIKKGLPCNLCGSPTNSPLQFIFTCHKCGYEEVKGNEKLSEDPMFCEVCNP